MNEEPIAKIWIDESNKICVQPKSKTFEHIYRSAMGVQWDADERYLYPARVISWTPVEWFHQIIAAVKNEYGYRLSITDDTKWDNVESVLKRAIESEYKNYLL